MSTTAPPARRWLFVVAGFLAIGLIGVPLFRYFLGLAIALGAGIAFGLYLARRWRRK